MTRLLIRNGTVVTSQYAAPLDVLVEGEQIAAIGTFLDQPADRVIDAGGLLVLPGIVDAHTHIMLDTGIYKTADNWLVGSRTAAAGGVTTVVDFATQYPGQTFDEAVDQRLEEAADSIVDYALHCMVTQLPPGSEDNLTRLIERGLPSFKIYTTYRPNYFMDDATTLRLMRKAAEIGGMVIVHAENDALVTEATQRLVQSGQTDWKYHAQGRPLEAEQEAVQRILFLAELANCPIYVVHCTTERSIEMVAQARHRGQQAWCETCPQYLLLDTTVYDGQHPEYFILQPPLRPPGEPERVWRQVINGAVSVISTDSCDYTIQQKREFAEFTRTPGGLPGLETLLPLIYTYGVSTGRISLTDLVRLLCENPARLFGIGSRKGAIRPGSDADIVLYDPQPDTTLHAADLHYLAGYNPYEGMRLKGRVHTTISRGEVIYHAGEFPGKPGRGHFVAGEPFGVKAL